MSYNKKGTFNNGAAFYTLMEEPFIFCRMCVVVCVISYLNTSGFAPSL